MSDIILSIYIIVSDIKQAESGLLCGLFTLFHYNIPAW